MENRTSFEINFQRRLELALVRWRHQAEYVSASIASIWKLNKSGWVA